MESNSPPSPKIDCAESSVEKNDAEANQLQEYIAECFPPLVHAVQTCIMETDVKSIDVGNLGLETAHMKTLFNLIPNTQVTEFKADNSNLQWGMPDFVKQLERTNVERLSFRGCQLRVLDVLALAKGLPNTQVKDLDLGGISFSEVYPSNSAHVIFQNAFKSDLTHLRLTASSLLNHSGDYLASVLPQSAITHLWLDKTNLGCIEGALAALFTKLPETSIIELYLGDNDIRDEHLGPLCENLRRCKLEKLDLSSNKITDSGMNLLAKGLVDSNVRELILTKNNISGANSLGKYLKYSKISALHLSYNKIEHSEIFSFPDFLVDTSLAELNLDQCYLGDELGQDLVKYLKLSKITKLILGRNNFGLLTVSELANIIKETNITEIDLSNNNFSAEALQVLSVVIKGSKLQRLVLKGGFTKTLHGSSIAAFFDGIKGSPLKVLDIGDSYLEKNSSILAASLPNTSLTNLDLTSCSIGMGVFVLGSILKDTMITHLNLSKNGIDDLGATRLAELLSETKIFELNIEGNLISDKGAEALTLVLKSGPLYQLNVDNNKITNEGIRKLAKVVDGTFITDLKVSSDSGIRTLPLVTVLWRNKHRKHELVQFFKPIAPSPLSPNGEGELNFDTCIVSADKDLDKFVEKCLLFYKSVIEEPSSISALAHAVNLSRDQVAEILKAFPGHFKLLIWNKTKKQLTEFIKILGKAKALGLDKIVEILLKTLVALIVKGKDGVLQSSVHEKLQEYKEVMCNFRLAPEEKKIVVQYFAERPPACGLCGKFRNLTKTRCCRNWICDDEHKYKLMSYARTSCIRNHRKYTLCGHHGEEKHKGKWQNCNKCKADFGTEYYADFGTNDYNFEKLSNVPKVTIVCENCGFQSGSLQDFGLQVTKCCRAYLYCAKAECQSKAINLNPSSFTGLEGIPMIQPLAHYNDKAVYGYK